MNIINYLKRKKRCIVSNYELLKAYYSDYKDYRCWQYHNPKIKSSNAFEAKILRQAHVLEKGMSLSHPKEKYGVQKATELLDYIDEYSNLGYKIQESESVLNALGVLSAYLEYHKENGFSPKDIQDRFNATYSKYIKRNGQCGIIKTKKSELLKHTHGEFLEFFTSRHSIRQFADVEVKESDIRKAVELAMKAPSACNRQPCKAYFYSKKDVNIELGKLIAGNTGFEKEVQNYLVVTSDMSAFYDSFERNQIYIDGGIFSMALVEALHYYKIASCILQNGEYEKKNIMFKSICKNIPNNEKIILFIAIGYYKDEFTYAVSKRKKLDEILIIS